jgi:hypothetical protein
MGTDQHAAHSIIRRLFIRIQFIAIPTLVDLIFRGGCAVRGVENVRSIIPDEHWESSIHGRQPSAARAGSAFEAEEKHRTKKGGRP